MALKNLPSKTLLVGCAALDVIASLLSFGIDGKLLLSVIILLRRKGFDPDIAAKMRSFKHEGSERGER